MSLCETKIIYNEIELKDVLTEAIDFSLETDSTDVDPVGMKVSVTCVAVVHTSENWVHGHQVKWDPPGELGPELSDLMQRLMMPRRRFLMQLGDQPMFDIRPTCTEGPGCSQTSPGTKFGQDIHHGPRTSVTILAIAGTASAKCRFRFEFVRPLCEDASKLKDLLNLRYWIIDDVDGKTWTTRRTYMGIMRVRGKCVDSHALARQITLPPIQRKFRRDSINWAESPNGLELQFAIVDVEQWAQAPAPATHWEGSYSVSIPTGSIAIETELSFRLWGDPDLDKRHLFKLAQSIIDRKLHYTELLIQPNVIVLSQVWSEKLEANEVSCNMRIKHTGPDFVLKNLTQFSGGATLFELGRPLDAFTSDYASNPAKRPYRQDQVFWPDGAPSAGLAGIFVSALQTPCCAEENVLGTATSAQAPTPSLGVLPYPIVPAITYDPYPQQRYSASHREDGTYLWYRMTSRYMYDRGCRGFPTAKPSSNSENTFSFARLHSPLEIREVKIHACRVDKWPDLPAKEDWLDGKANIKYVLRNATVEPCAIQLAADGRHDIREVYATYWYYMSKPLPSDKEYLVGNNPYIGITNADGTSMPTDTFMSPENILGGGG